MTHKVERIYPNDPTLRPQTLTHHLRRYQFAQNIGTVFSGEWALDLACGSGYGTEMLRQAGYKAFGVDINKDAIYFARLYYPENQYWIQDVTTLCARARNKFSVITFFEALEHIDVNEGKRLIALSYELLRPGGLFLVSTLKDCNLENNPYHKSQWDYQELDDLLKKTYSRSIIFGQDWDTGEISKNKVETNDFFIAVCQK